MNGETLDEASKRFHDAAWLAALQGFCNNPEHHGKSPKKLAELSAEVAYAAEDLFRKMNLDLDPATLSGQPERAVPAKVKKSSKKGKTFLH